MNKELKAQIKAAQESRAAQLVTALPQMSIATIAMEVRRDWKQPYFGASPYLSAMLSLGSVKDNYGSDSGSSIVAYFLGNAQTWKGPVAKVCKAELNKRLKAK